MDIFTVSFFGHREIDSPLLVEQRIEKILYHLLIEKLYVQFLVGRDGEFDQIVSSVIRRSKRKIRDDNCTHVWVLPYPTARLRENEADFRDYYDDIEICESSVNRHYKAAYQARNQEMVDRSNLVIFCVQHNSGGAWKTMMYAKKKGVNYINIGAPTLETGERFSYLRLKGWCK